MELQKTVRSWLEEALSWGKMKSVNFWYVKQVSVSARSSRWLFLSWVCMVCDAPWGCDFCISGCQVYTLMACGPFFTSQLFDSISTVLFSSETYFIEVFWNFWQGSVTSMCFSYSVFFLLLVTFFNFYFQLFTSIIYLCSHIGLFLPWFKFWFK